MTQCILLAEDDVRLARLVKDYLECNGDYSVIVESDGQRVPRQLQALNPDLLILDVMLPNKDGLTLCRELRPTYRGPILMLTARNDDADQILGLECGADDYVIKPAEPSILLARIRALLRRYSPMQSQEQEALRFGILVIHRDSRTVTLAEQAVPLSSHEFDLLLVLAGQPSHTLSREYLFNAIYHRAYDGMDRTIDVRISQLRKKLGDSAERPFRIKTVWGRGYMFVPDAWEQ